LFSITSCKISGFLKILVYDQSTEVVGNEAAIVPRHPSEKMSGSQWWCGTWARSWVPGDLEDSFEVIGLVIGAGHSTSWEGCGKRKLETHFAFSVHDVSGVPVPPLEVHVWLPAALLPGHGVSAPVCMQSLSQVFFGERTHPLWDLICFLTCLLNELVVCLSTYNSFF
jgi:hypothetical protein